MILICQIFDDNDDDDVVAAAADDDGDDVDDDDGQKLAQSCSWHCLSLAQAADKPRLARSWQRNLAFAIKIWTRLLLLVNN